MSSYPKLCLVDTNVPANANLTQDPARIPDDLVACVLECVKAVENVVKTNGLVIDEDDEIFDEYRNNLSMSGQPGVGDKFMKWVHDHRWTFPSENRVKITKNENSYNEFPGHQGLTNFDLSDHKFVAVANAHPQKPSILQATDSKWWGFKDPLKKVGINVIFLCPDYSQKKYSEKME